MCAVRVLDDHLPPHSSESSMELSDDCGGEARMGGSEACALRATSACDPARRGPDGAAAAMACRKGWSQLLVPLAAW